MPDQDQPQRTADMTIDLAIEEVSTISKEDPDSPGTERTDVEAHVKDKEFPDGGSRAWLVVFGAASMSMITGGVVTSWGVFQAYYSTTLLHDVSPSALSWIGSAQYALTFFPGIFTGRLFDLGHFHVPMLCFSILMLVATFLIAECTQYWHFLLCQGLAVGVASGCLFGPLLGCVAHWFKRRRSTACAIAVCGTNVGGTVFPILVRNLTPIVGFRWTMRIFGFVVLVLMGIGNLTLRRRLPPVKISGGLFNFRVLQYAPFSFYVTAAFFCFLGQYTVLIFIAESYGVSENLAFYMTSIANASAGLGRIWIGTLADRIGPINTIIPMTAIAAFSTYAWPYARTWQSLLVISVMYGMSSGTLLGLLSVPVATMGNIGDIGRRQGMLFTLLSIGAILGPPISGWINQASHGYPAVGFFAGSVILVGLVFMSSSRGLLVGRFLGGKA